MSFSKDVKSFTQQYRRRMNFIAKTATQEMMIDANIPWYQGGRQRVDTGFLRSSVVASTNGPPQGPTEGNGPIARNALAVALLQWSPATQVFWAGWSASYATIVNLRYGYRDGAVEKWSMFVANATREAQAKKL